MNKKSHYPDVPANPDLPSIEENVLARWEENNSFKQSVELRDKDNEYVFYDGPPFANGLPHYGHLLTSFVKDLDARYRTMKGKRVERRFGWDCHGLPAEMEAEKELGVSGRTSIESYGIDKFNAHCQQSVMKYTDEWKHYINRAARWVDFEHDYKTMNRDYMESVLWAFKQLYDKGLIYESHRVMPYSWAAQTPLSNFETRMDDAYRDVVDKAVYVKFAITDGAYANTYLVAWTTTPWTLPSNLALAISDSVRYVKVNLGDESLILAESALDKLNALFSDDDSKEIIAIGHSDLIGLSYDPLFPYFNNHPNAFKVLHADFIEEGEGTGIVHLAPGFGEDDQHVCEEHDISLVVPVDDAGCFTEEIFDIIEPISLSLGGINVVAAKEKSEEEPYSNDQLEKYGLANLRIINYLKHTGQLIKQEDYSHSYPHCWRTDQKLIFRAVSSWYVEVTKFRDRMVELNQTINWIPEHIRDGQFGKWLEGARDWSISRNRFWGTPIPIWRTPSGKTRAFGSLEELEAFFDVSVEDLHRPYIDSLTKEEEGETWTRVTDVFDCWFESGAMPFAQVHYPFENKEWFEAHFPADFIVEYVGQTRGWFYTLVVLATALFDKIPFKNCICHGIILDENGKKLSKRLRNYPDPQDMFNTYGADAMRWRMLKEPIMHGGNLLISKDGSDIRDVVRLSIKPFWNAYHFFTLYANADGIKAQFLAEANDKIDNLENIMDYYILDKLKQTVKNIDQSLDRYLLPEACDAIEAFFDVLNNWYIRRNKDRFWKSEQDKDKQSAYDTLYTVLHIICRAAAPILPLTMDEIFAGLSLDSKSSVHHYDYPDVSMLADNKVLLDGMDLARDACNAALAVRSSENIRVRQPLAMLTIVADEASALNNNDFIHLIKDEVNVKQVEFNDSVEQFAEKKLQIHFPLLGKRLPEKMKAIIAASKKGEWKQLPDGRIEIFNEILQPEESYLVLEPKYSQGAQALSNNNALVILDTDITETLKNEGIARDIVRFIQQARKDADLHISDRIELALEVVDEVKIAIEENKHYITEQTLASILEYSIADSYEHKFENQLDDQSVRIGFSKVA